MKKQEQSTTAFDKKDYAAQMRASAQLARGLGHEEIAAGNESVADYIEELEKDCKLLYEAQRLLEDCTSALNRIHHIDGKPYHYSLDILLRIEDLIRRIDGH